MSRLRQREELKQLESLHARLVGKISGLEVQQNETKKELSTLKQELNSVNQKIRALKHQSELIMSEHAILRYVERVLKIDLDSLVTSIVEDSDLLRQIETLGNGTYPMKNGDYKVVVKNNVIITVVGKDS
ncbi:MULTISPECIES: hypothetical protein [unclassified Streptococcus]|uniref:hypothetical protein n=1 Tax=unclassified Streptococcus TaxID=2608887 RepID=UPI00359DD59C